MPIIPILLPKIGESVYEATVSEWLKKEGDTIAKDEVFVEITTDKVTSELPSEYRGVLKRIIIAANQNVKIGKPLGELEVSEKDYEHFQNHHQPIQIKESFEEVKTTENAILNVKNTAFTYLSPVVRKIAQKEGLSMEELEKIPASGHGGRLTKKDVERYLSNTKMDSSSPNAQKLDLPIHHEDSVITISGIRKMAANTLSESYREIPHVTTFLDLEVSTMVAKRNEFKKDYYDNYGLKLTYTHYCFFALIKALQRFPQLNSWFNQDEWIQKKQINLGFATSLPNDILIVPNLKNAQNLDFQELVDQVNRLAKKAKNNQLVSDDFSETTFTVSNTGIFGSMMGTPLITKPQVGVLALGAIRDDFYLNENDEICKCKKMYASLSYDHRVINGALASKFLMEVQQQLQN